MNGAPCSRVAVFAGDLKLACVQFMGVFDGLFEVGVSFLVTGLCFCVCWVMSRMRACQVQSEDGKKKLLKEEETAAAARAIWEQGASDAVVTQPV